MAETVESGTAKYLLEALGDIAAERRRQIEVEGWTPEHDDAHTGFELSRAAAAYALEPSARLEGSWPSAESYPPHDWPWAEKWWKPTDNRRDLVKAAALIIAEIERLDRLAASAEAA